MGRYQLNKGERFTLKKSEDLTNLTVSLGWKGGADLDACAFLLGEDGTILDDADFVFYNSNNREEAFSREKFGNKKEWMKKTALCRPTALSSARSTTSATTMTIMAIRARR